MLSESVPQNRRDGKPQLWSALFFLTYSGAGMKVPPEHLLLFALRLSLMLHNYLVFFTLVVVCH